VSGVERVATVLAVTLVLAALAAAVSAGPDLGQLSAGLTLYLTRRDLPPDL
jgi:hypothetical protein